MVGKNAVVQQPCLFVSAKNYFDCQHVMIVFLHEKYLRKYVFIVILTCVFENLYATFLNHLRSSVSAKVFKV